MKPMYDGNGNLVGHAFYLPNGDGELDMVGFEPIDSEWRGIGTLPLTGLGLRQEYSKFNAAKIFPVNIPESKEPPGCKCGDVLKGIVKPFDCKLFASACTPEKPIGPCMVSSEGSCAAYFKYERKVD